MCLVGLASTRNGTCSGSSTHTLYNYEIVNGNIIRQLVQCVISHWYQFSSVTPMTPLPSVYRIHRFQRKQTISVPFSIKTKTQQNIFRSMRNTFRSSVNCWLSENSIEHQRMSKWKPDTRISEMPFETVCVCMIFRECSNNGHLANQMIIWMFCSLLANKRRNAKPYWNCIYNIKYFVNKATWKFNIIKGIFIGFFFFGCLSLSYSLFNVIRSFSSPCGRKY